MGMKFKILLVGQPNVGKSSLLNALVGPKVIVSNYPGTTVEVTRAVKIVNGKKIEIVDTPGIYSISDMTEEEKVTEKALFEESVDGAIIVADSDSLERSLYFAFQVLESGISVVLALNFVESAEKKGITIEHEKLSEILGIPVVPVNPLTRYRINELIDILINAKENKIAPFNIKYDDHIEEAIQKILPHIEKNHLPERFIALRLLEEDIDFYKYLKDKKIVKQVKEGLKEHPRLSQDIAIARFGTAAFIAKRVTRIVQVEETAKSLEERIDRIILHRFWGPTITLLTFTFIFGALLYLGGWIEESLMHFIENVFLPKIQLGSSFFGTALEMGLTGVMAGIAIALPYVFLFYFLFTLIEDTGILSRFVINLGKFLGRLNLPGKAIIPLALGLGCTAPGIRATRVLSSEKERFCTAALFTAVPCSSRIAIVMGIVGHFGSKGLAVAVFVSIAVAFLIFGYIVKKIARLKKKPALYELPELPPYRIPSFRNIAIKSWIRMKTFVYIVIPFLVIGGVIYGTLDKMGITQFIVKPFSPVTWWLNLPEKAIIPWAFAFLQKDLSAAMLFSVLGSNISSVLSPLQIYTFGVATTVGIPCMIASGILWKEFGFNKAFLLTILSAIYGLLFAGLAWRGINLFL
jgi:ferrous iron transport protein B